MNGGTQHLTGASENGQPPVGREASLRRGEQQSKGRLAKVPCETGTDPVSDECPEKSVPYSSTKPLDCALRPVDVQALGVFFLRKRVLIPQLPPPRARTEPTMTIPASIHSFIRFLPLAMDANPLCCLALAGAPV